MNKYEKAYNKIEISHEMEAYRYNYYVELADDKRQVCINEEWENELNLIQELVKRATPKKLTKYNEEFYECECGTIYKWDESNFCGYCGNKIDWSE